MQFGVDDELIVYLIVNVKFPLLSVFVLFRTRSTRISPAYVPSRSEKLYGIDAGVSVRDESIVIGTPHIGLPDESVTVPCPEYSIVGVVQVLEGGVDDGHV